MFNDALADLDQKRGVLGHTARSTQPMHEQRGTIERGDMADVDEARFSVGRDGPHVLWVRIGLDALDTRITQQEGAEITYHSCTQALVEPFRDADELVDADGVGIGLVGPPTIFLMRHHAVRLNVAKIAMLIRCDILNNASVGVEDTDVVSSEAGKVIGAHFGK